MTPDMTENETLQPKNQEPIQLDLFENPDVSAINKEAAPKTLELFRKKSDFLLNKSSKNPFTFSEIFLRDFIGYVFERKNEYGIDAEPFEEEGSREYLDIWLPQHDKHVKKVDYSGYGIWRYNPIVLYRTKENGKLINKHSIILKDYAGSEKIDFIESRIFSIISPITYVGRNRYAKNARYLYAFVIDLDGVEENQIRDVIHQQRTDLISKRSGKPMRPHAPMANIIVNSGHGLHMYYLLDHPVALFKENVPLLRKMKEGLTNLVWNEFTSNLKDIQYQGIYQGFRMPGTLTKFGEKIRAFRNEDAPMHSISSLNGFLSKFKLTDGEISQLQGKTPYTASGITKDEAKRLYPEWYERVIVMGDKRPKKWHIKRDLYDWWLRRLRDEDEQVVPGHRYFCLLTLAIYAMKCDIEKNELARDAYSLLERMDKLTNDEDNHFTKQDIEDALMGYKLWYCTFPRNSIKYLTGLEMKENRRNRRKQSIHLKMARSNRDILSKEKGKENWWEGGGRPVGTFATIGNSKVAALVEEWMLSHPNSHNKSECARDLGLTRPTVTKWWKLLDEPGASEQATKQTSSMPFDELRQWMMENLEPVRPQYQMELTADEMMSAMTNPDDPNYDKIWRKTID